MPRPCLETLPTELKRQIISNIDDTNDVQSLALVSRALYQAVAPIQFRRLELSVVSAQDFDAHKVNAITGSNIQYTKELLIKPKRDVDTSLNKLAELLPKNLLLRLDLSYNAQIPLMAFLKLCHNQAVLKSIVVPRFSTFSSESLSEHGLEHGIGGANLHEIKIRGNLASWENTCLVANKLIASSSRNLKRLQIMPFGHWLHATNPAVVAKKSDKLGPVLMTLFKHMVPSLTPQPLILTHLTLDNVPLDCSEAFKVRIIDFPSLSEFHLRRCSNSTAFLEALTTSTNLLHKVMRLKIFEYAEYRNKDMSIVERFLNSFKGLSHLYLVFYQCDTAPDPACIIQHADSLSLLIVESATLTLADGNGDESYAPHQFYTLEQFRALTDACSKLRQLSIYIPSVDFDIGGQIHLNEDSQYLDALVSLPNLQVLNIAYLYNDPDTTAEQDFDQRYWDLLGDRMANLILSLRPFPQSKLSVLSIGSCTVERFDAVGDGTRSAERVYFTSARAKDWMGREQVCAMKVSMAELETTTVKMDMLKYKSPWWR